MQLRIPNDEWRMQFANVTISQLVNAIANDECFAGFAVLGGLCDPWSGNKKISQCVN